MEGDKVNNSSGGISGRQRARPLQGRNSGPTRRSTKGQWTFEEDEILRQAVDRFKGKNWKKIAECFKDRTDVQCLHRWQKVLNPNLIKGPWSKEEDEVIMELVNKYGPKKWSTIAQHLPGRIGKQCRERWHNHLNPAISKEAWTQEEELALIRAHQVYGNKWAELTKFLPGRSDNAIKNHWNSSVKKKLDTYLASGVLEQFQGLPHDNHANQSVSSSSSRVQQYSGDDCILKDGTEAEENSECSQDSTVLACSQANSSMANAVVHTREDFWPSEECTHGMDSSSRPVSPSDNYHTCFQDVTFSMPEIPYELGDEAKFLEHNFSHDWVTSPCKNWQLENMSPLELDPEPSRLLHCMAGNENNEEASFALQNSVALSASPPTANMVRSSDKQEHMLISEDGCTHEIYPETSVEVPFSSGNLMKCSNIHNVDRSTDALLYQSSNHQISECSHLVSNHFYSASSDMLGTSCYQPFPIPSQLPHDPDQFNDLALGNQEEELLTIINDGFIHTNCSTDCNFDNEVKHQPDQEKDCSNYASGSGESNNIQNISSKDEKPVDPAEHQDAGFLFYEPPRFPSLDVPFLSCDLIPAGTEMQEYSPLGIRQLMNSSLDCCTPFRLWDSPLRDGSPDAVLKSAAKTFTCTPSILKKRHRDLVSPLSEKRSEKKLEISLNQESFSNLTRNFSRLDVMFDRNRKPEAPMLSPPGNLKRSSGASAEDKENTSHVTEMGKKEARDCSAQSENGLLEEESHSSNPKDKTKQGTISIDNKTKCDADAAPHATSGVLVEQKMNDLLFFSPDQFGIKSNRTMSSSAKSLGNQYALRFEAASKQVAISESEISCLSVLSPPMACRKSGRSHIIATASVKSDPSSAPMGILLENSAKDDRAENLSIFGETPFKRSIESPSAWKSPWFNTFVPGPRVDTDITVEDIGFFMSPGDRSYDAIGLLKHLSEHTASSFADAQEVLGDETPDTILKKRCSNSGKADQEEESYILEQENGSHPTSNAMIERRVLDFSECETPGKGKETGRFSSGMSFSSPSSYLLKGFR